MSNLRTPVISLLLCVCGAGCSGDAEPAPADIPIRYRAFAAQLELERQALEIPGLAVAILEHGELAFAHGFGTKGSDSSEPIDAATLFRIGSMSKLLTAIGVVSAAEDDLLELDAPLRNTIPDLSLSGADVDALNLRRLLSQQTGLGDFLVIDAPAEDRALADFSSGPELSENVPFINPPGLFWNYSNPNYYLAGRALEVATNQPYRLAIDERVFTPLGMQRSFWLPSEVLADGNYTHGFGVLDILGVSGAYVDLAPDSYDNGWARPAGYAFSNVLDWVNVMQFLMQDRSEVLASAARSELISSQISTQTIYADLEATALGLGDDYGLGVGVSAGFFMDHRAEPDTYYATPVLGHGGDIPGFASTFLVLPETGFGMVVLSNRDAERPTASMRFALESFAELPAPSAAPPGSKPDPSRFASYAGTYRDIEGDPVEVTYDGTSLSVSVPALDRLGLPYEPVLEPSSLDNFAIWIRFGEERLPLEATFITDDSGEPVWFRSRVAVARKAQEAAAALAP
jgi:CubicO group peptidase (beta-lactamase class C family)